MNSSTTATIDAITQILLYQNSSSSYSISSGLIAQRNAKCVQHRLYSSFYILVKGLVPTYLRFLIVPGILLNILCYTVLSRPRLSKKSTTVYYLSALAILDMLCICLKFFRAELNYQSAEKRHNISFLTSPFCKLLYVLLNTSVSVDMWIIVLMSIDKLIAVRYPLKSATLSTPKRACISCLVASSVLLCLNLYFVKTAGIKLINTLKYCTLLTESILIDVITASFLPIGIIISTNVCIAIVLHNATKKTLSWNETTRSSVVNDNSNCMLYKGKKKTIYSMNLFSKRKRSTHGSVELKQEQHHTPCPVRNSLQYEQTKRQSCRGTSHTTSDNMKRTSTQVTRMLLAVTSSLIIFNIPNTFFFILIKIYDPRLVLHDSRAQYPVLRNCSNITDKDLNIYKFGVYSSLLQNILSDLPHVVNFFIYCFAGKKFRIIFKNEMVLLFQKFRLLHKRNTAGYYISMAGLHTQQGVQRAASFTSINQNSCQLDQTSCAPPYTNTKLLSNHKSLQITRKQTKNHNNSQSERNLSDYNENGRNKRSTNRSETITNRNCFLLIPCLGTSSQSTSMMATNVLNPKPNFSTLVQTVDKPNTNDDTSILLCVDKNLATKNAHIQF